MIVADTNVVSELMKDRPNPGVLAWAGSLDEGEVTISVVTVEEIERGLARLDEGRRRRTLSGRWHELLRTYADRLLVYDVAAAQVAATVVVHRETNGRPISLADAQIAGICLARDAELATRNISDFEAVPDLRLVNPFT